MYNIFNTEDDKGTSRYKREHGPTNIHALRNMEWVVLSVEFNGHLKLLQQTLV